MKLQAEQAATIPKTKSHIKTDQDSRKCWITKRDLPHQHDFWSDRGVYEEPFVGGDVGVGHSPPQVAGRYIFAESPLPIGFVDTDLFIMLESSCNSAL